MKETERPRAAQSTAVQPTARFTVMVNVVRLLEQMTSDWDLELIAGIRPDTRLITDLGFRSMDIYVLGGRIQQQFGQWDLPFADLHIFDGDRPRDVTVAELVDFLHRHLDPVRLA